MLAPAHWLLASCLATSFCKRALILGWKCVCSPSHACLRIGDVAVFVRKCSCGGLTSATELKVGSRQSLGPLVDRHVDGPCVR
jgi:hypothetical protein